MQNVRTTAASLPRAIAARAADSALGGVILVVAGSLLLALSAQVAIPLPFSPVPLTLQPLAVLLLGAALGPTRGAAAAVVYLFEGAAGFPVFSEGRGGIIWLLGPTAGYLFAFPAAAAIAGWAATRGWTKRPLTALPGMALALATIHAGGWSWLVAAMGLAPVPAFAVGVVPFLIADAVKVLIAAALLPAAERIVAAFSR